jgi:hypothetical protein
MRCKGIVKGNMVLLEEGVQLPDGIRVTVTVEPEGQEEAEGMTREELEYRRALITQMKAFGARLAGRQVNLGAL